MKQEPLQFITKIREFFPNFILKIRYKFLKSGLRICSCAEKPLCQAHRMLETAVKLYSAMVAVLVSWIISRLQLVLPLVETKHQKFAKLPATEIGDTAVNSLLHKIAELRASDPNIPSSSIWLLACYLKLLLRLIMSKG